MKYAGKTFTLYANEPVAVEGSDSLYTYQNTGTGTATLQGSNNGNSWSTLTTVTAGSSYTGSHSYAFLRMTGSTEVSVNRGVGGGSAVSASNPLPVLSQPIPRNNHQESLFKGRAFKLWVTIAATPSKYASVQIFNPASSGKAIYVVGIAASNSAGTMKWYPLVNNIPLATLSGFSRNLKSDGASPSFELRTEALTARTANDSFGTSIGSVTPQGNALNTTGEAYLIMPGDGLRYEVDTQNIGATLYSTVFEIPLSEMP